MKHYEDDSLADIEQKSNEEDTALEADVENPVEEDTTLEGSSEHEAHHIQTFIPDMNDTPDAEELFDFDTDEVLDAIKEDIHDTKDISSYIGESLCDTDGVVNPYLEASNEQEGTKTKPKRKSDDKDIDLFGDLKPTEKAWWNKYKVIMTILLILGIMVVVGFAIFFCTYFFGGKATDDLGAQIKDEVKPQTSVTTSTTTQTSAINFNGDPVPELTYPEDVQPNADKYELLRVDFDELKKKYPNVVGWLSIPGTDIEYPVTQCDDNEYYLTHSIDGTYTRSGWVFADYRMSDSIMMRNYLIYGHNMADGTSFGKLKRFIYDTEWQSNPDNQYIYYTTEYYTAVYQIFNVMRVKSTEVYYHNRELDNSTMQDYLTEMSQYNLLGDVLTYDTPFKADDRIITLSTCNDAQGYEKFVVQGILIHKEQLKEPDDVIVIN